MTKVNKEDKIQQFRPKLAEKNNNRVNKEDKVRKFKPNMRKEKKYNNGDQS
jgi:hypothetical protein